MNKKKILIMVFILLCAIGGFCTIYFPNSEINNVIDETQKIIIKEITVSDEIKSDANDTKDVTLNSEEIATTSVLSSTIEEEQDIVDEGALEADAIVEQENISYDGTNTGNGLSLLGSYQGLTYYSQADSRWANTLYTSTNNKTQTMKSSACGPTSTAMIVSSSKGAILPTTLAKLSVDNGFRTASSGTAWAFYPFIADYFDFEEYYTTNDFDVAMNYLKQKENNGDSKYYIIASCGSGLFTSSGHYICLMGLDNNTIKVYDPYIYNGKFNTASRKNANVTVNGNTAYVSKTNFKKYANFKSFWVFSNDQGKGNSTEVKKTTSTKTTTKKKTTKSYTRYINVKSTLNVRKKASTNSSIVKTLKNGTKVTVYETSGKWSRIAKNQWVKTEYLSKTKSTTTKKTTKTVKIKNTVGQYKRLKTKTTLYSKSNLSGTKYNYLANTQVKIIKNISSTVDYVYIVKTKKYAYVKNNVYK